jgi:uncharacterized protein (UPF0548 family)
MILLARPTDAELERLLVEMSSRELTYPDVGRTREPELPTGYRHDRSSVVIGNGDAAFRRGQDALRSWQAHSHAGVTLTPPAPALKEGNDLIGTVQLGLVFVTTPCRIVYVTDDKDAFGFGYGTLPGHPERGEEAFHVRRGQGGETRFEIVAFSRPADLLARLGSPVALLTQKWVTSRYLEGVRQYVAMR